MTETSPLPTLESTRFRELGLHGRPHAVGAYEKIPQTEARTVWDETDENVVSSRVVGHLFPELYGRYNIIGDQPAKKLSKRLHRRLGTMETINMTPPSGPVNSVEV